ncbi:MAG: hypothetical protein HC797_05025 [Anaerolineales bacterium]|nr:hypothetical protein [Anaerolineales bacterium]
MQHIVVIASALAITYACGNLLKYAKYKNAIVVKPLANAETNAMVKPLRSKRDWKLTVFVD